ncbi:hypothetical protein DXA60_02195 [Roseburia sp. OF03-24]|nr:hypothetical protein DXA60_02195 [Roseburia sp. OF03-24]
MESRKSGRSETSVKNNIFHTQDLCLRTNLRCAGWQRKNGDLYERDTSIFIYRFYGQWKDDSCKRDAV